MKITCLFLLVSLYFINTASGQCVWLTKDTADISALFLTPGEDTMAIYIIADPNDSPLKNKHFIVNNHLLKDTRVSIQQSKGNIVLFAGRSFNTEYFDLMFTSYFANLPNPEASGRYTIKVEYPNKVVEKTIFLKIINKSKR